MPSFNLLVPTEENSRVMLRPGQGLCPQCGKTCSDMDNDAILQLLKVGLVVVFFGDPRPRDVFRTLRCCKGCPVWGQGWRDCDPSWLSPFLLPFQLLVIGGQLIVIGGQCPSASARCPATPDKPLSALRCQLGVCGPIALSAMLYGML